MREKPENARARMRVWYERNRELKKRREREAYAAMTPTQKVRKIALITQRRRRVTAERLREELNGPQG